MSMLARKRRMISTATWWQKQSAETRGWTGDVSYKNMGQIKVNYQTNSKLQRGSDGSEFMPSAAFYTQVDQFSTLPVEGDFIISGEFAGDELPDAALEIRRPKTGDPLRGVADLDLYTD